jgi:hypothetical protein
MKLAILGADADALELARWAVEHGGHEIVAAYDSEARASELRYLAPRLRLTDNWEELFVSSVADAVIVGRGGREAAGRAGIDPAERRADQFRKLVQAAVPMIVVCPACEAIVGFEIEMIRRDVGAIIVPYVPGNWNPALNLVYNLAASGEQSEIGPLEQATFEREQADRSRDAVLLQLSRDISVLRGVIGFVQTVTASGPTPALGRDPLGPKPAQLPDLANLNVVLGGDEGLSARWSILPAAASSQGRLTLIGKRGRAVVTMPADGDWKYEVVQWKQTTQTFPHHAGTSHVFDWLQTEMQRDEATSFDLWSGYCRDQEAAEAVDRSLARGRTIELFGEEHTEEQSFKGIMAMGGCFMLVAAIAVLGLVVVVESLQLPIRELKLWRLWPVYLLVPIVVFLLLQFLHLAVKREDPAARPEAM